MDYSISNSVILFAHINVWVVLLAIGGYQLYLQWISRGRKSFDEGITKPLQHVIGIPALAVLVAFLLHPNYSDVVYIPTAAELKIAGAAIFNIVALMIFWAHVTLGEYWSGDLETKQHHRLVDSGLYRWVRHPLYTSYVFMTVGLFLLTGNWLVGLTALFYCGAVAARSWREEEMLLERLGERYALYMERTGRFLIKRPRVRPAVRRRPVEI